MPASSSTGRDIPPRHRHRTDPVNPHVPHQWEVNRCPLPRAGVELVQRLVRVRLGGVGGKPAFVELLGFGGAEEVPAVVPDLDPGVVAALAGPRGDADEASGEAAGAAGVD